MDLKVEVGTKEFNILAIGCFDIKRVARWSVSSLEVQFEVASLELLQKFENDIEDTKVGYVRFREHL